MKGEMMASAVVEAPIDIPDGAKTVRYDDALFFVERHHKSAFIDASIRQDGDHFIIEINRWENNAEDWIDVDQAKALRDWLIERLKDK